MSAGRVVLTPKTDDLDLLGFKDQVHLLTYESTEEAIAKIKAVLDKPFLRKSIGKAAREKIIRKHTFVHRTYSLLGWDKPDNIRDLVFTVPRAAQTPKTHGYDELPVEQRECV
jgi:spore maturation protein CgeB